MKTTLVLLSMAACSLMGQVAYDNATLGSGIDTTLTFSHTTGSGSNRAMAVICTVASTSVTVVPNISTVTYAGVSLTQLAKVDQNYDTYIWTLPNGTQPTSGANNVVVTLAASMPTQGTINCGAITVTGVDSVTTWTVSNCSANGSTGNPACTLGASGANDMVVVGVCHGTGWTSPGSGITSRIAYSSGFNACDSLAVGTAAGNTTSLGWTASGDDLWQILGAAFKASGGAPTAVTNKRIYVM